MLYYKKALRKNSRILRRNQTESEKLLWSCLRRKQICDVQFYRQKPLGNYIVDFYAPSVSLIIEIDGSQHFEKQHMQRDKKRDNYFAKLGLRTLRFTNADVFHSINDVAEAIYQEIYTIHSQTK